MILLLYLVPLVFSSSSPGDDARGKWTAADDDGNVCIMLYAQIDLTLTYVDENDAMVDAATFSVPSDATTRASSCAASVAVGDEVIESQVLQLDFPHNDGWNVRLAFTRDGRLDVNAGDYALFQVNITANYSSMPEAFKNAAKDHTHTYNSIVDFVDPPEIASDEYTRVGDSIYCPSAQGYIINSDTHLGPPAAIRFSNLQMQAYMTTKDFGKKVTCAADQTDIDLVPVVVSAALAGLVLFTLVAYFVYRSRLPSDILDMTTPEFEEEDDHTHNHFLSHQEEDEHAKYNDGFKEESRF